MPTKTSHQNHTNHTKQHYGYENTRHHEAIFGWTRTTPNLIANLRLAPCHKSLGCGVLFNRDQTTSKELRQQVKRFPIVQLKRCRNVVEIP